MTDGRGGPREHSFIFFFAIFIGLTAGIVGSGYFHYQDNRRNFRTGVDNALSASADLNHDEPATWRAERLSDAGVLLGNPAFSALVQRALEQPDPTTGAIDRRRDGDEVVFLNDLRFRGKEPS